MRVVRVGLCIFIALHLASAKADTERMNACHVLSQAVDGSLRGLMKKHNASSVLQCDFFRGPMQALAGTVSRSDRGVCHYSVIWIERKGDIWSEATTLRQSDLFDARSGRDCPPTTDARYVATSGIDDIDFLRLVDFWQSISSARDRYDEARPWFASDQQKRRAEALRRALFAPGASDPKLQLENIWPLHWMNTASYASCILARCYNMEFGDMADANITVVIWPAANVGLVDVNSYVY